MSDRAYQINSLRKVFAQAKNALRDDEWYFEDLDLHGEILGSIIDVGKYQLEELKSEVYPYLKDPFSEFRAEAVRTLGWNTRLGIDDFCLNEAPKIWLNDLDEEVKVAALVAWAGHYSHTKNSTMLKILYDIFSSNNYSILARAWALTKFFDVADGWLNKMNAYDTSLYELESHDAFNKMVDWEKINKIMSECVQNWSSEYVGKGATNE